MVELDTRIIDIIPRTPSVKSFRLDSRGKTDYKAGQFMQVSFDGKKELSRYLSISSSPTEEGYLEFTKKITESEFSKRLNAAKIGDSIKLKYPFGNFVLDEKSQAIAFLSGGIGITPIRSICKYVCDSGLGTNIVLIYGNRSLRDIAFKEDFDAMVKQYPHFKAVNVLSSPEDNWQGKTGRIDKRLIQEEVPDYFERKFYICGPPLMVSGLKAILSKELNLPDEKIVIENFKGY